MFCAHGKGGFMQVVVTGSDGKIGRLLRRVWADGADLQFQPIWSSRRPARPWDVAWDIEQCGAPSFAQGAVILHLAGVVRGDAKALQSNRSMARRVCDAALAAGAKHVFLASSAAVYGSSTETLVEVRAPAPLTAYGRAKLAMERDALCWAQDAGPDAPRVTCLRIGNVLGADALFGQISDGRDIVLDPALESVAGPLRSYIGPKGLAQVLAYLFEKAVLGVRLPPILNIAAPDPVYMADLLEAAHLPYRFGPNRPETIPKVCLSTKRLADFVTLPKACARAMVKDWRDVMASLA